MKTAIQLILTSVFWSFTFYTINSFANNKTWVATPNHNSETGINFSIPFRGGIHHGQAKNILGVVITDSSDGLLSANFKIPIIDITTSNNTRDCHMREALGLNYETSDFPESHVCERDNQLPTTGPNSIAYPDIILEFAELSSAPANPLPTTEFTTASAKVILNIHGIQKTGTISLKLQKIISPNKQEYLRVVSRFDVRLPDFGIIVKPLKIGPISLPVRDVATVKLDLLLKNEISPP